jgi:hypothetical protein
MLAIKVRWITNEMPGSWGSKWNTSKHYSRAETALSGGWLRLPAKHAASAEKSMRLSVANW